jgi:hypothetical protein
MTVLLNTKLPPANSRLVLADHAFPSLFTPHQSASATERRFVATALHPIELTRP